MQANTCPQCGAPTAVGASECRFCGEPLANANPAPQPNQRPAAQGRNYTSTPQVPQYQNPVPMQQPYMQSPVYYSAINPAWPLKSKLVAGLLAIFLGCFGIHKFYLGKIGSGIIYLLFSWTGIPAIIGVIEGIIYLCSNDENFSLKHHVRLQ